MIYTFRYNNKIDTPMGAVIVTGLGIDQPFRNKLWQDCYLLSGLRGFKDIYSKQVDVSPSTGYKLVMEDLEAEIKMKPELFFPKGKTAR